MVADDVLTEFLRRVSRSSSRRLALSREARPDAMSDRLEAEREYDAVTDRLCAELREAHRVG